MEKLEPRLIGHWVRYKQTFFETNFSRVLLLSVSYLTFETFTSLQQQLLLSQLLS